MVNKQPEMPPLQMLPLKRSFTERRMEEEAAVPPAPSSPVTSVKDAASEGEDMAASRRTRKLSRKVRRSIKDTPQRSSEFLPESSFRTSMVHPAADTPMKDPEADTGSMPCTGYELLHAIIGPMSLFERQ